MKERAYVITFTILLCAAGAGLVKTAQLLTKDRIEANQAFEKQINLADVLGIDPAHLGFDSLAAFKAATPDKQKSALDTLFAERIEEVELTKVEVPSIGGRKAYTQDKYTFYIYYDPDTKKVTSYAFPIGGGGFQGKIKGYLGVSADQKTITGVTFYDNQETPGLGGRISSDASEDDLKIRRQFKGKQIDQVSMDMLVDFSMVNASKINDKNKTRRVEAITAATQTSNAISSFIKTNIQTFYIALLTSPDVSPGKKLHMKLKAEVRPDLHKSIGAK